MDVRATRWIGWALLVCTGCVNSEKNRPVSPISTPSFQQIPAGDGKNLTPQGPTSAQAPPAASKNPIQQAMAMVTPTQPTVVAAAAPPPPPTPPPAPRKSSETTADGKRTFTTDSILTFARMKEQEANALKDNPDKQMQMRDMARVDYQEVLRRDPKHREALLGLTRVYSKMRDYPKAEETVQKGLAIYPNDADLWTERGLMFKDRKDFDEAVRSFEKALAAQPENREMMKRLGYALGLAGRMEDSFRMLQRAVGAAQAHYRIAQFHELRDDMQMARRHCLMALQEQANFHPAQEMLVRLGGGGAQTTALEPRAGNGQ
jgi:Tfp pilus assembly protein PilF